MGSQLKDIWGRRRKCCHPNYGLSL